MGVFSDYLDKPTDGKIRFVFSLAAAGMIGCMGIGYGESKYMDSVSDTQISSHPDYLTNTENCLRGQVMVRLSDQRKTIADNLIAGKTITSSDLGLTGDFYQKAKTDCQAATRPVIAKSIADNDPKYISLELAKIPAALLILGGLFGSFLGLAAQAEQDKKKNTPKP